MKDTGAKRDSLRSGGDGRDELEWNLYKTKIEARGVQGIECGEKQLSAARVLFPARGPVTFLFEALFRRNQVGKLPQRKEMCF